MSVSFRTLALATLLASLCVCSTAQAKKLKLQTAGLVPGMVTLVYAVGDKAGFLAEEGLTYEIQTSAGASIAAQLIANNSSDIGLITFEPVLAGYSKGMRGKFINQFWSKLDYKIGLLPESPITSAAELKDKPIGVPTMASSAVIIGKAIMRNAGVDPSTLTLIPIGTEGSALNALRQGRVAAYAGYTSGFSAIARFGQDMRFIEHPTASDIGNGGFYVSPRMLEDPQTIVKFLRAMYKAAYFIESNPEAALKMFWEVFPNNKPRADNEEAAIKSGMLDLTQTMAVMDLPRDGKTKIGEVNFDKIAQYVAILTAEGYVTSPVDPHNIATNEFNAAARDFDIEAVREKARKWPSR